MIIIVQELRELIINSFEESFLFIHIFPGQPHIFNEKKKNLDKLVLSNFPIGCNLEFMNWIHSEFVLPVIFGTMCNS